MSKGLSACAGIREDRPRVTVPIETNGQGTLDHRRSSKSSDSLIYRMLHRCEGKTGYQQIVEASFNGLTQAVIHRPQQGTGQCTIVSRIDILASRMPPAECLSECLAGCARIREDSGQVGEMWGWDRPGFVALLATQLADYCIGDDCIRG